MANFNNTLTNEEIEKKVSEFQKWAKEYFKMSNNLDKSLLARYLKLFSFREHKAQAMLKYNLELRVQNPWFFTQRDYKTIEMKKVIETFDMVLLPQHTPENYKVCIVRLLNSDISQINLNDIFKMYLMTCDARFHLPIDDYRKIEAGDVIIFDMKHFTLKHLTKAIMTTLKLISKYFQFAHPVRLVQFHVINASSIVNKSLLFIRPFVYRKIYRTLHFHPAGSLENLYKYVPRDMLPSDYNGMGDSMSNLKMYWFNVFESYNFYVTNDNYWKVGQ